MLSNFRKTKIIWDRASNVINTPVRVSSSDTFGRTMEVQVLDGGNRPNMQGVNLNLAWETEDGHYQGLDAFDRKDAKSGLFELYYTTGMLSHKGNLKGNLQLVDSVGTVTSEPFTITVFKGLDGEGVQSSNSFTALDKALGYVSNIDDLIGNAQDLKGGVDQQFSELEDQILVTIGDIAGESSATRYKVDTLQAQYQRDLANLQGQMNDIISALATETGSNSRGKWLKRADGTMECTMRVKIKGPLEEFGNLYYGYTDPNAITFPQQFDGVPSLSYSADSYNWFFATSSVTPTRINKLVGYRALAGTTLDETYVTVTAHGYWRTAPVGGFALEDKSKIPKYWNSHLNSKISRVKSLQSVGTEAFSFGFITDMHMEGNAGYSGHMMKKVVDETGIDTVINGGDQANNGVDALKSRTINQIEDMFRSLLPVQDIMLNAMGNHDDNSISRLWAETMKHDELYSRLFRYMGSNVNYGPTGKYFYKDDNFQKVRYIVLDSIDIPYIKSGSSMKYLGNHQYAFRQEQIDWFAKEALDTPTGWSVIVVSHNPVYEDDVTGVGNSVRNANIARGILRAYKMKRRYQAESLSNVEEDFKVSIDVDFRDKGGDAIIWLAGHTHFDNVVTMPDGIPMATTLNDSAKPWSTAPKRTLGTISEHAFDIVTVNKRERNVYLTRVGAGQDRVIKY